MKTIAVLLLLTAISAPAQANPMSSVLPDSIIRLAANESEEPADPIEEELAREAAKLEMQEDLTRQIDGPLEAFSNTVSRTLEARGAAAQAAADDIYKAETAKCRLNGVRDFVSEREYFLNHAVLTAGVNSINPLREALLGKATYVRVTFPSSTPPDPTEEVTALIEDAGKKIKALNADFNVACADMQKKMGTLPATEASKMQALSAELQKKNDALSLQVKEVVDALNQKVNALDAPLANWAVESLKNAKPQKGPAAQD